MVNMMDNNENFKFIDEDSPQHVNYVWKKKRAVLKSKHKGRNEKDFRQICIENVKDESSFEDSCSESRTYFGKEGSSSGDDITDIADEEEEFSSNDTSLSPRAPLVLEEDEAIEEVDCEDLEIIVSESDHERIALTTGLTVKDEEETTLKQNETELESIIKLNNENQINKYGKTTKDVKPRRRVHFKDISSEVRKCHKKPDVPPLIEEGFEIDVLFEEDVTIRVSFKEGKVIVEESEVGEGNAGNPEGIESKLKEEFSNHDKKQSIPDGNEQSNGLLEAELLKEKESPNRLSQSQPTSFICSGGGDVEKLLSEAGNNDLQGKTPDLLLDNSESVSGKECEKCDIDESLEVGSATPANVFDCIRDCADRSVSVEMPESNLRQSFDVKTGENKIHEAQPESTDSEIVAGKSKLEHELQDSEKCSTVSADDCLSINLEHVQPGSDEKFEHHDLENSGGTPSSDTESDNSIDSDTIIPCSFANESTYDRVVYCLHDIIEEESCSDLDNGDYTSSDSTVNCNTEEFRDKNMKKILSNDENLKIYSNIRASEYSSNSDSSVEKCEIETSEKEIFKQKSNPILNLLEMQEKEEIFESSLELLQEFRSNLIPGITSASDWISCCDSDELSIGVVGEEEEEKGDVEGVRRERGRRTALSTAGAESRGTRVAEMLSTYPPTHAWQFTLPSDGSDSDSLQGDSLDTVIQVTVSDSDRPLLVDRETQADSKCERCCDGGVNSCDEGGDGQEEVLSIDGESLRESESTTCCDKDSEVRDNRDSVVESEVRSEDLAEEVRKQEGDCLEDKNKSVSNDSDKELLISDKEENTFESVISDKEAENENNKKECYNSNQPVKDLFQIKRSANALENLPLIFPHVREISVSKPVNKFENLFISNFSKSKTDSSDESNDRKLSEASEVFGIKIVEHKPAPVVISEVCGRVDIKTDNLFQFNVKDEEGVTSFREEVRESSEDDMKQKKRHEDNRSREEAVGTSNSELCNGYHKGVLKSALKRGSSKKSKKKNRVTFDESLNKFFDADYVILIREEPDEYEAEYDFGGCECGESFCYDECCDEEDDEDSLQEPPSPFRTDLCAAFDPPVEFVDQVTLSPPDGYKDTSQYCPHHHPRPPGKRRPGKSYYPDTFMYCGVGYHPYLKVDNAQIDLDFHKLLRICFIIIICQNRMKSKWCHIRIFF